MQTNERRRIEEVQHRAVLLADMIKLADHLMTEANAPTRLGASLICQCRS